MYVCMMSGHCKTKAKTANKATMEGSIKWVAGTPSVTACYVRVRAWAPPANSVLCCVTPAGAQQNRSHVEVAHLLQVLLGGFRARGVEVGSEALFRRLERLSGLRHAHRHSKVGEVPATDGMPRERERESNVEGK